MIVHMKRKIYIRYCLVFCVVQEHHYVFLVLMI